jgi:type IV pilus assembly protein PilV
MKNFVRRRRMAGITMIESLVALVVIAVGMLGIAGLYLASLQAGRSANLRIQALNLTTEMADRIRANRNGLANYVAAAGATGTQHDCATVNCTPKDVAENDVYVWKRQISASLPANANGQITFVDVADPDPDRYVILLTWREAGSDVDSTFSMALEANL